MAEFGGFGILPDSQPIGPGGLTFDVLIALSEASRALGQQGRAFGPHRADRGPDASHLRLSFSLVAKLKRSNTFHPRTAVPACENL
jgi:hypothetical protein